MGQSFRDRIVWQRSIELCTAIYAFTQDFPKDELFALTNQMRRAAVSIPSNIAEGHGRNSTSQLIQFLCHARGSNYELQTQLIIATNLGYGKASELTLCESLSEEVGKMLNTTLRSLQTAGPAKSANI